MQSKFLVHGSHVCMISQSVQSPCDALQAATTVDELEARTRWEAADAGGKNSTFDAAVSGPRFKAPGTAAAVARALPIVTAAHK